MIAASPVTTATIAGILAAGSIASNSPTFEGAMEGFDNAAEGIAGILESNPEASKFFDNIDDISGIANVLTSGVEDVLDWVDAPEAEVSDVNSNSCL